MIWFLIWLILLGFMIWLGKTQKKTQKWDIYSDGFSGMSLLVTVTGIILFITASFATIGNITINPSLERNEKNIVVYEEKYENIKNLVVERISSYPLEEKLIKSFNPKILLSLPEIKSDKIVISMIEQLISIQNDIYKIKIDSNEIQMRKDIVIRYKWLIPAFVYPSK